MHEIITHLIKCSELQELINLEEQAQKQGKGLWSTDNEEKEKSKRPLDIDVNPATIFEQLKGKPQSGSLLIKPSLHLISTSLVTRHRTSTYILYRYCGASENW